MPEEKTNKELTKAADNLAEQASNEGADSEKASDERAEAEKKVTQKK